MKEKLKLDENGMILDNDSIYEKLDKWYDNDEYDKILEAIYELPREVWSNKLWFRVIDALNNKKEFGKSINELNRISERCKTAVDMGQLYYMYGYIYEIKENEIRAFEYYKRAMQVDPKRDLTEKCEKYRERIKNRFDNLEDLSEKIIQSISNRLNQNKEKVKMDDNLFTIMLGLLPNLRKVPKLDKCVGIDKLFFKFQDDEKELVREHLLKLYGIKDVDTLKEVFSKEFNIAARYEDVRAYIKGEADFDLNKISSEGRVDFNYCKMFVERIIDKVPKGGIFAWDISERLGILNLAYGCDLMNDYDYTYAISIFTDEAKKWYSSWEEYIRGLIFGGSFYMFWNGNLSVKSSLEFLLNISPILIESDMLDCMWHNENIIINLD